MDKMKKRIFIKGKRNGYSPEQCGDTLTVAELIEILKGFDGDSKIYIENDNGYTFGSITEMDIRNPDEDF